MIFPGPSELDFRVQRTLASQTAASLLSGDEIRADQVFFAERELVNLLAFALVEVFAHVI